MNASAVTALVVRVPEAEPWVHDLRALHDPSAAEGVPAHVTILVPFITPADLTAADIATLDALFARHAAFDFTLTGVRRWPETAWLAPEPAAVFAALTQDVVAAYPQHLPYGGRHAQVVPHLSVADGSAAAADTAERALRQRLHAPIACRCHEVELIDNASGRFERRHAFALGTR
jgi:2'-5' RNA ligase